MKKAAVDKHLSSIDFEALKQEAAAAKSPEEVIAKICEIYKGISPILETLENLFFVPAKWRKALRVFTGLLDGLCNK